MSIRSLWNKVITWASNFIGANFFWKATSDHAAFGIIHQICQIQFEYSKYPNTEGCDVSNSLSKDESIEGMETDRGNQEQQR